MRDPILHIKKSDLVKVLAGLLEGDSKEITKFANDLLSKANRYQLRSMYVIKAAGKTRTKLQKTVDAESGYVEKFNGMLSAMRLHKNHLNAKPVRKTDPNYIQLKEITKLAVEFAEDYGIEFKEEAFKFFISTGLDLMGKRYALNKFKYYKQKIVEKYEALEIIKRDNNPKSSERFYKVWKIVLAKYATALVDIETEEDYSHIVLARIEADEYNADYKQWITAQFEELAFLDAIPSLNQLYGLNAARRYQKYTTKRKREEPKEEVIKFTSPEQAEYFRLLRERRADKE